MTAILSQPQFVNQPILNYECDSKSEFKFHSNLPGANELSIGKHNQIFQWNFTLVIFKLILVIDG